MSFRFEVLHVRGKKSRVSIYEILPDKTHRLAGQLAVSHEGVDLLRSILQYGDVHGLVTDWVEKS